MNLVKMPQNTAAYVFMIIMGTHSHSCFAGQMSYHHEDLVAFT